MSLFSNSLKNGFSKEPCEKYVKTVGNVIPFGYFFIRTCTCYHKHVGYCLPVKRILFRYNYSRLSYTFSNFEQTTEYHY